jgi:N-acyl-D-amino-acid deacylase
MTTAIAVYGLRSYGEESSKERIDSALNRAFEWSLAQSSDSHEDLIGQIWLESMIIEEQDRAVNDRLGMLRNRLLESQRSDGGWSQMAEMSSDAYATGQAVIMLSHLSNVRNDGRASSAQQRAAKFLLENQQPDGSWYVASRSKPVQVFFDNGDPHGKDQFISIMATSWATAALREIKFQTLKPLVSVRVAQRLGRIAND